MQLAYAHGRGSPRFLVVPPPLALHDVRVCVLPPCDDVRVRVREALRSAATAAPAVVPIAVTARIACCFGFWYCMGGAACAVAFVICCG